MSHIKLICFSRDRAPQLDLLLRSLAKNAPIFSPVVVIYKATTPEFQAGYDELMNRMGADLDKPPYEYPDKVIFHKETDFRDDVLFHTATAGDLVCYATDDSVVYRRFEVPYSFIEDLLVGGDVTALSLRIGLDTTIETYFKGNPTPPLMHSQDAYGVMYWCYHNYNPYTAFGYVYSMDTHIFWKKHILDLITQLEFRNPNELEGGLSQFSHKPGVNSGFMAGLKRQHVVSSPVNSTSDFKNRAGDYYPQTPEYLNEKFLSGQRIDLDAAIEFCVNNVNCTHYEIKYSLQDYNVTNP